MLPKVSFSTIYLHFTFSNTLVGSTWRYLVKTESYYLAVKHVCHVTLIVKLSLCNNLSRSSIGVKLIFYFCVKIANTLLQKPGFTPLHYLGRLLHISYSECRLISFLFVSCLLKSSNIWWYDYFSELFIYFWQFWK